MPSFLVCYDLPRMSGLWAVVEAPSAAAIIAKYPEVAVVTERPPWMSEDEYERKGADPLWLDEEVPSGIFHVVVVDRTRT